MTVDLKIQDIQGMNQICTMLHSQDNEQVRLGITLVKAHPILRDFYWEMTYDTGHKEIPVRWFFDKLDNEAAEGGRSYRHTCIKIIQSIIQGEAVFRTPVRFRFDYISRQIEEMQDDTREADASMAGTF